MRSDVDLDGMFFCLRHFFSDLDKILFFDEVVVALLVPSFVDAAVGAVEIAACERFDFDDIAASVDNANLGRADEGDAQLFSDVERWFLIELVLEFPGNPVLEQRHDLVHYLLLCRVELQGIRMHSDVPNFLQFFLREIEVVPAEEPASDFPFLLLETEVLVLDGDHVLLRTEEAF